MNVSIHADMSACDMLRKETCKVRARGLRCELIALVQELTNRKGCEREVCGGVCSQTATK